MIRNSPQVFAGGWKELQHSIMTENEISFSDLPHSHFFKPDGMILFITTTDVTPRIESHPLTTPWIVDSIAATGVKVFNITEDIDPRGITFSPDGTIMVIVGSDTDTLYSYVLPIPWDIESIVDAPTSLLIPSAGFVSECVFSRDGDFIFVTNGANVKSLPLPTNYDITSNVSFTIFSIGDVQGVAFKPEGDRMFASVDLITEIEEFNLSTPWDITTAVSTGDILDTSPNIPKSITVKPNGLEFFIVEKIVSKLVKYHLQDEWHVETGSRFSSTTTVPMGFPVSITWKPDGTRFYILNAQAVDVVLEFSVPFPFNLMDATQIFSFPVNPPETNPRGMFFHPDGSMFWIIGTGLDNIIQFNMTVPWDLSTAFDPSISASPAGLSPNPQGLFFGNRGLKVYITDSNDDVMEYNITTPYDLSTFISTPVFSLDISTNTLAPRDVVFHPNGTIMYIISLSLLTVSRYVLTTSWSISSAVFVDSLDVSIDANPQGLFIRNDDGKKLYMVGASANTVYTWDMKSDFNNAINVGGGELLATDAGELLVA